MDILVENGINYGVAAVVDLVGVVPRCCLAQDECPLSSTHETDRERFNSEQNRVIVPQLIACLSFFSSAFHSAA